MPVSTRIGRSLVYPALLFSCLLPARAQVATGSLNGKLTDKYSLPLAEATVTLRNLSTGTTSRTTTAKNGSYHLTNLGPGEYRLEAEVPTLGHGQVEGILIAAGHATRVQAALILELPSTAVEAGLHQLDPVAPTVTTLLNPDDLASLPVASRDWQSFAAATPAANPAPQLDNILNDRPGTFSQDAPGSQPLTLRGLAAEETTSSIDDLQTTPAFQTSQTDTAQNPRHPGPSATLTLEVRAANTPAEAPQSPGAGIRFKTAHGTNGLHGQAFYRNKQSLWQALNPFTQWAQQTTPLTPTSIAQFTANPYTPPSSAQTFGLGIGSQLKRDKLFWFAALDGALRNDPAVAQVRHPDQFFLQPTNDDLTVLAARLDLQGPNLFSQENALYSGVLTSLASLLGPVPRTSTQLQAFARLDWQTTERHHLSLEANAASENAPASAVASTSANYGSHSFGNSQASGVWALARWDSFLTPNLLNDLGALASRNLQSQRAQNPSPFESTLLDNPWNQLPQIIADSKYGFILGKPARLGPPRTASKYPDERSLFAQDTLSWVHGPQLVKAGASFTHTADLTNILSNQTGTYSYADLLNFISDASAFQTFGLTNVGTPTLDEHNCDASGRVYHAGGAAGPLAGRGDLPCYAWYSQRIGPANWNLSTNDYAAFLTEQWQPFRQLTLSAGIRAEAQQLPPPIGFTKNPDLATTEKLPATTLNWGPRFGLAWSPFTNTVLRLGAGLYYGRIDNSTLLAALTQTGSPYSDLNFFFRPTDQGAPPFPYVFPTQPVTTVTPGAVLFAPHFRPQQVDQAVLSLEQQLPSHWLVSISAMASLGRRLPVSIDTNIDPTPAATPNTITYAVEDALQAGPLKTQQITVPLFTTRLTTEHNLNYQQLNTIEDRANSTYQAAMVRLTRYGAHGFSLRAHYLYAHATDWNPNESSQVATNDVLDPFQFNLEYGTSNLDIRHSAAATLLYETPWKLHHWLGQLTNFWSVAAIGQFRSGLPYTLRTSGYIPGLYNDKGALIEGLAPGINGSGGDNRIYGLARNTYRYPSTYTADARLAKRFDLANHRELQLLAESFNLFNHQNVTLVETTGYTILRGTEAGQLPILRFLTGLKPGTTEFGKPLAANATNFYRQREIQLGLRARF